MLNVGDEPGNSRSMRAICPRWCSGFRKHCGLVRMGLDFAGRPLCGTIIDVNRFSAILVLLLGMLSAQQGLAGDDCSSAGLDPGATAQQACPDDGCDEPCPGEDEDGSCSPDCEDCSCCLVLTASTAVLGSPPDATPAWTVDGPDLWAFRIGLLAQGPRSRIFHPPRRMLS